MINCVVRQTILSNAPRRNLPRRRLPAAFAASTALALACIPTATVHADELSELRAQIKAMREASATVERRLAKLERERATSAKPREARLPPSGQVVGAGPGAQGGPQSASTSGTANAGPTQAPVLAQTGAPGFLLIPGTNTALKVGGFIKIDGVEDIKGGGIGGTATDFTEIPLKGTNASRRGPDFNATARQTQLAISSLTPTAFGDLKTYASIDFYGGTNGTGLYTNSYAPRLFEGYVSFSKVAGGSVLVGQTWSTFMDLDSYPETLDLNGPLGTVFIRQPMLRYVHDLGGGSKVYLAAEAAYADFEGANPYPVYSGGGAPSSNIINPIPDFVGKYTYDASWGHVAVAGIARYIKADTGGATVSNFNGDSGVFGGGFVGAATIKTVGKDTINVQGVGAEFVERPARAGEQRSPLLRQLQRWSAALEQPEVEARLKVGDAPGQCRFGAPRRARGATEAAVRGDEVEVGQGLKIHAVSILKRRSQEQPIQTVIGNTTSMFGTMDPLRPRIYGQPSPARTAHRLARPCKGVLP